MSAYCRVDKVVMYYTVEMEFFDDIIVEDSTYDFSSVGRYALNLAKRKAPGRWRRLLDSKDKVPNLSLWWELHAKYEEALVNHT
jgi:hypothetical protein